MRGAIGRLWREHRALFIGFSLAVFLTLFFALRMTVHMIYWADPAHRDRLVEPWMTPRYIARSWDLPERTVEELVRQVAGDPAALPRRPTLERIARARGIPVDRVIVELNARLTRLRELGR